jgi:SH3-like domain-containing protein
MRVRGTLLALWIMAAGSVAAPAAAQDRQPPYWASISSGQAMMRTGPARTYPGIWLYQRRDLPVRVVQRYEHWRLIQDPQGQQGWMLATLLSDRRTAMVRPGDPRPVHARPEADSRVRYLAQAGVVGRIDRCRQGWCRFAVGKRQGFIRTADIWGAGEDEAAN